VRSPGRAPDDRDRDRGAGLDRPRHPGLLDRADRDPARRRRRPHRPRRAELARALSLPFVEAARGVGASRWRLVARHALPHAIPQLAVAAAITFSSAVLSELALTFLGFGTPPPTPSWGELLRQAQQNQLVWWLAVPAGAAVAFVTLCANALADELTRASGRA
jgi:peptide/nickel transport system permease protein